MLTLRHISKRRHQTKNHYLKKKHGTLDMLVYAAAVVGPIMTIPQIQTIWINKTADGVSATSWATYAALNTIWIAYGAAHKEKVIFFSSIVWLFINSSIAIGAIIY